MILNIEKAQTVKASVGAFVSSNWKLVVLACLLFFSVTVFRWETFVSAGFASLLITVLPCLAMCALGLCMHKRSDGNSCNSQPAKPEKTNQTLDKATIDISEKRRGDVSFKERRI